MVDLVVIIYGIFFLYLIFTLLYGVYIGIMLALKEKITTEVEGTVIYAKVVQDQNINSPGSFKKLIMVTYYAKGKMVTSRPTRIGRSYEVGDIIKVRYFNANTDKLYFFSFFKLITVFLMSALTLLVLIFCKF